MQVDWAGGTNVFGLFWCHKCSWIGLVAQMHLGLDGGKNAVGLGWWHKC